MSISGNPEISVIVPFYNAARSLELCLQCLLAQDVDERCFEIIAVNNNSDDDSVKIVRGFKGVQLINEKGQGSYAARNAAIKIASGQIIAFTDADCAPRSNWLSVLLSAFENRQTSLVLGSRNTPACTGLLALWSKYERTKECYVFSSDVMSLYYGHTNNMAVRRSVFNEQGLFHDRRRGSDTIFVRQVVAAYGVGSVVFCARMEVTHLELLRGRSVLYKLFLYGRSSWAYRTVADAQPLSFKHRWNLYRRTVNEFRLTHLESLSLFVFLAVGMMCWSAGAVTELLSVRPQAGQHTDH